MDSVSINKKIYKTIYYLRVDEECTQAAFVVMPILLGFTFIFNETVNLIIIVAPKERGQTNKGIFSIDTLHSFLEI